ncbi:tyrosinase family protein [Bradyrhizobium sp. 1]|uniref:tyrosinase family protein n=1 Tax=Bradyrhizobium sp. 1 TaxID=241591 RepID=UPI001FF93F0F
MRVDIQLPTTDPQGHTFLTWVPVKATARMADASGASNPARVTLQNGGVNGGGRLAFDSVRTDAGAAELDLELPTDGTAVEFWVAGEFQHPSSAYGDVAIDVMASGTQVGRREMMVRIRKNAVNLSAAERDRFLLALGKLNNAGHGVFQGFRDAHVTDSLDEAHGFPGFPAWHRAYMLDLERTLQEIDSSVTLPYWRFDEPAAALFDRAFLGMPPVNPAQGDTIQFPHGHALEFWKTDTLDSIDRRPTFNINGAPPAQLLGRPNVISQAETMLLGMQYDRFRRMEGAPHGRAHTSFDGPINLPATAPKDPLFFLLHANVDRLWAFWQWFNQRTDSPNSATYSTAGAPPGRPGLIGHNLGDTMWPWNQSTTPPRPTFPPPRGQFPTSPTTPRPGPQPTVRDMIDWQGIHGGDPLGFDYDDVPFELHAGGVA